MEMMKSLKFKKSIRKFRTDEGKLTDEKSYKLKDSYENLKITVKNSKQIAENENFNKNSGWKVAKLTCWNQANQDPWRPRDTSKPRPSLELPFEIPDGKSLQSEACHLPWLGSERIFRLDDWSDKQSWYHCAQNRLEQYRIEKRQAAQTATSQPAWSRPNSSICDERDQHKRTSLKKGMKKFFKHSLLKKWIKNFSIDYNSTSDRKRIINFLGSFPSKLVISLAKIENFS